MPHSVYGVLRSALRTAADLELIERAPIRGVRLPSIPKTEVTVLRPGELVRLAVAVPTRWRPMIYVAGGCALRFAEVAGLRVGRLDLAHRLLQVTETAPQVGPDRAEPKTASGFEGLEQWAFADRQTGAGSGRKVVGSVMVKKPAVGRIVNTR